MEFKPFDARNYPTLDVREGYAAWAPTYESTVLDLMDIRLLERLGSVDWTARTCAVDLACGTGRTGSWLKSRGVKRVEGVDFTPLSWKRPARAASMTRFTPPISATPDWRRGDTILRWSRLPTSICPMSGRSMKRRGD